MRILLIENDTATAQSIELILRSEAFTVYTTDLGEEGVELGKLHDYDLILLDLNLPGMSGLEVLRTLRAGKNDTPIVFLSGSSEVDTKVSTLTAGGDDFITKPFHKQELVARIQAVARRRRGNAPSVVITGNLTVDLDAKTVQVGGERVKVTGKEFEILELLSMRKGAILTAEMIMQHLYGGSDEPDVKIIGVFMCKLRKKLAAANHSSHHIETVWGRGFVLSDIALNDVAA